MGDKCNLNTWKGIPIDRQEALKRVFELYSVYTINQDILNNLDSLGCMYQFKLCHQNSILFSKLYESQFECILVEGIAINANGEAFMHYWNKFKTMPSKNEQVNEGEYDVTHDLLMPEQLPFLYHAIKEYKIKEIPTGANMNFSKETEEKLNAYLAMVPDAKPKCNSMMMNLFNWEQCPISIFIKFREKYNDKKYASFNVYSVTDKGTHIDAFASRGKTIFYDEYLCKKCNLTEKECFACIVHEIGHIFDPTPSINNMPSEERELNADKIVIELGLQEHLISALKKLCVNDSPDQKLLTDKRIKVLEGSHN